MMVLYEQQQLLNPELSQTPESSADTGHHLDGSASGAQTPGPQNRKSGLQAFYGGV